MSTEKFRTREQILSSKYWSGEDTGRAYLYSLIAPLEGKPQIPDERLLEGVGSLVGNIEKKAYEGYKALYQFITFENGQMQALEFATQAQIAELEKIAVGAGAGETTATSIFSESIKVSPEEFARITERTVQNITGESGYEPRYFDIDDIVDLLAYQSTIKGDPLILSPDVYNRVKELLGSELPEINTEPPVEYLIMFNSESSALTRLLTYVDVEANPQIDRLRDMTKAQRAALRDSLCKRLSNSTNYAEYKANPTMNSKFTEFREDMRARYGELKVSGLTLYYYGFSCFFLLVRHSDTVFYDCERKRNGVAVIPGLPGVEAEGERRANVMLEKSSPDKPAFYDVWCNDYTKQWREENGLASISKKRSASYKKLMEQPGDIVQSFSTLCAYNELIDLIADRVKMPSLELLKNDLTHLIKDGEHYSLYLDYMLAKTTGDLPADNPPFLLTASERRKYKAFAEALPRIELKEPTYTADSIAQVKEYIKDLEIFSLYPVNLITILENGGESNEQHG